MLTIPNRLSQVPHFTPWTQVERAHCGALLRADQDVAATREGTVWNQVSRAAILAIILMNIHVMTR
jgi:hypothetical protein